jgi:hypothetical protein
MKSWGFFLVITAVLSVVLPRLGLQFLLLMWIDNWGTTIGWIIRAALVIVGATLIIKDSKRGSNSSVPPT